MLLAVHQRPETVISGCWWVANGPERKKAGALTLTFFA
jgi:hypothetical protein